MELTVGSIDQTFNIVSSLLVMQILQRYPIKNILFLRLCYMLVQILQFIILYIIKRRIQKINDKRTFMIKDSEGNVQRSLFGTYDNDELSKSIKQNIFQLPIVLFLHYKMELSQPLLLQIITFIKNIVMNPLYHIYLYREKFLKITRPFEETVIYRSRDHQDVDSDEEEKKIKKAKETGRVSQDDQVAQDKQSRPAAQDKEGPKVEEVIRKTEKIVEDDLDENLSEKKVEE